MAWPLGAQIVAIVWQGDHGFVNNYQLIVMVRCRYVLCAPHHFPSHVRDAGGGGPKAGHRAWGKCLRKFSIISKAHT
jgi:hypothetical protein